MKKLTCLSYFLLIIFCLGVYEKSFGMNAFKQNFTWKKAALVGIAGGCTVGEYALGASDYFTLVRPQSNFHDLEEKLLKSDDVDPIVESFVRKHLIRNGIADQSSLKVKQVDWINDWAATVTNNYKWILVKPDRANALAVILNIPDSRCDSNAIEKTLGHGYMVRMSLNDFKKETIAILHHEAGHIKNEDVKKGKYAVIGIPLSVATMSYALRKKVIAPQYFWTNNITKLLSGLCIGNLSAIGYYQFTKHRELKADDNVADNIHLLQAKKQEMKCYVLNDQQNDQQPSLYQQLLEKHPRHKVRLKRLKKRIKVIKEKGDPKAFEDPLAIKESEIK